MQHNSHPTAEYLELNRHFYKSISFLLAVGVPLKDNGKLIY